MKELKRRQEQLEAEERARQEAEAAKLAAAAEAQRQAESVTDGGETAASPHDTSAEEEAKGMTICIYIYLF